jgi:hypothetical protein
MNRQQKFDLIEALFDAGKQNAVPGQGAVHVQNKVFKGDFAGVGDGNSKHEEAVALRGAMG